MQGGSGFGRADFKTNAVIKKQKTKQKNAVIKGGKKDIVSTIDFTISLFMVEK